MLLVATMFAMQPICNATWAAHALRSDQKCSSSWSPTSYTALVSVVRISNTECRYLGQEVHLVRMWVRHGNYNIRSAVI